MRYLVGLGIAFALWLLMAWVMSVYPCEVCGRFGHGEDECPVYREALRRRRAGL